MKGRSRADSSRELVLRASLLTYILSHLIPQRTRTAFFHWYAYLRWVDDTVDQAPQGAAWVAPFLDRQYLLLDERRPTGDACLTAQEIMLRSLISHDGIGAGVLAGLIRLMVECIGFDTARLGRLTPHDTLRGHWCKEARCYLASIAWFCGLPESRDPPGLAAAVGAKIVHVLRDFGEDMRAGQFNVSSEEVAAFGLQPGKFAEGEIDDAVLCWMAANARCARALLAQGLNDVRHCPRLRYKLIVVLLTTKYQCYVHDLLRVGLRSKVRLRSRSYLVQLARNLGLTFGVRLTLPRRAGMFSQIVRPARFAYLGLLTGVASSTSRPQTKDLQRSLARTVELAVDPRRMRRRFRVACFLGRTAFEVVAPGAAATAPSLKRAAGLVYGYWSICAIELDRLMDSGTLSPSQARRVADGWLRRLHELLFECTAVSEKTAARVCANEIFDALTAGFMRALRTYYALCRSEGLSGLGDEARSTFYAATTALMDGQLRSLLQMEHDRRRDWSWYCSEILNSKNMQFLFAPFHLWRVESGSEERLERFVKQFQRLNRAYLHYQLIDDVSDLTEDTSQGVIGAPAAILLAQGSLAQAYLSLIFQSSTVGTQLAHADAAALLEHVRASGLLNAELVESPLFDRFRHRLGEPASPAQQTAHAESSLRCALSNRESDLALTLEELARSRDQQAMAFLETLRCKDAKSAQTWLLDSGTPDRLLNAVGHDAAVLDFRRNLNPDRACAEIKLLYVLERLMRHTYRAARDLVLQDTSSARHP